jgi:hypothetical protein
MSGTSTPIRVITTSMTPFSAMVRVERWLRVFGLTAGLERLSDDDLVA